MNGTEPAASFAKRKRRGPVESSAATTAKRQRIPSVVPVERQEVQEDEAVSDSDEAPRGSEFYDNINGSLLLNGTPAQGRAQTQDEGDQGSVPSQTELQQATEGDVAMQPTLATSFALEMKNGSSNKEPQEELESLFVDDAIQEQLLNENNTADLPGSPDSNPRGLITPVDQRSATPAEVTHASGRRQSKRQQSKRAKPVFGQPGYVPPGRQASVELGSDAPVARITSPTQVGAGPEEEDGDVYEVPYSDGDMGEARVSPTTQRLREVAESSANDDSEDGQEGGEAGSGGPGNENETALESEPDQTSGFPEDSLLVDVPGQAGSSPTTEISSEFLSLLVSKMSEKGWAEDSDWLTEFAPKVDQDSAVWLRKHVTSIRSKQCRSLFRHLSVLREITSEMPKSPDIDEQFDFLREKKSYLDTAFSSIRGLVDQIARKISSEIGMADEETDSEEPRRVGQIVASLHSKIIPMLVLVLREAFMVGGHQLSAKNGQRLPLEKGEFTSSTLQILLRIIGWTQRLHKNMWEYLQCYPPKPVNETKTAINLVARRQRGREKAGGYLDKVQAEFRKSMETLDRLARAPELERQARENDRKMKLHREQKDRERREAQERQWQLFVCSTQQLGSAARSTPAPQQGHQGSSEDYYQRYGGWHYWEDDKLLNTIRKVLRPNMSVLATRVPSRSVAEVEQRVKELKDRMREKYEQSNMVPPQWCYHYP